MTSRQDDATIGDRHPVQRALATNSFIAGSPGRPIGLLRAQYQRRGETGARTERQANGHTDTQTIECHD